MAGGSFGVAAALPSVAGAVGAAGFPAGGGAAEVAPAAVAPVAGSLTGLLCGPELQAAATRRGTNNRFISISGVSCALRARSLPISRPRVCVDPVEYGVVPELAVPRLEHPVALVGEVEQARLDPAPLERREHPQALLDGDAEVELALDHQRGRLESLHVAARREAPVQLRVLPGRAAEFPLREPELLGGAVLAGQVEDAVVRDQALEAVGVAGDPVDHVAAEARAGRAGVPGVDVRQLLGRIGGAHHVLVREAAPVAGDLLLELLPVPDRAVEIGGEHHVSASREDRRVPAHAPSVFPR